MYVYKRYVNATECLNTVLFISEVNEQKRKTTKNMFAAGVHVFT
jgi:hypothetical protein